jgi:L-asparaginase II
MPLVLGLALGANLVPLFALILIAWPTNREAAYATGNKEITIKCSSHSITTDLAHLFTWMLCRFLHRSTSQTQSVTKLDSLIKHGS